MSDLKITLEIPVFTKFLTGTLLGEKVFKVQVMDKLTNDSQRVVVEFPENVEDVSTSFVLGMYSDLKRKHGSTKALQMMTLYSSCQDLNNKLQKIIDVYGLSGNS